MKKKSFLFGLIVGLYFFAGTFCHMAKAEELQSGDGALSAADKVDNNLTIELTVNLEDDSRFMGVSVYLVGEYDGNHFAYSDAVKGAVKKDYYLLDRAADRYAAARSIAEYIEETKALTPVAEISVVNGIGSVKGLPVGLYLLVQNGEDYNSRLVTAFLTEAPDSSSTGELLYDIKLFPKWERTVWFSFRPEVINPLGIVVILGCCLLLALFGSGMFRALIFALIAGLCGYLGMKGAMQMTDEYLWYMVVFVSTAFLGVGVLYTIYRLTLHRLFSGRAKQAMYRQMFWITPLLALLISAPVVRFYVSSNILFWLVIPGVIAVLGFVIQLIGRKDSRNYRTYEDLLCMDSANEEDA